MKKAILIITLACWAVIATAATPLPPNELHRLAAYLSYITVTAPKSPVDESYKAGDTCGACGGRGSVGDGVIESPCDFVTPDGLLACKGTGKLQSTGGQMDVCEVGCALCESVCDCDCGCKGKCGGTCGCDNCNCGTPERDELFDNLDNPPAKFNESYVRELEYDLQKALEEVENLKACPDCPTCVEPQPEEIQEETPEPEESSSKTVTVYRMKGSTWNWEGRSNPSTEFMRQHLKEEHGIDASLMDRKAMQAIHDNCHNYGDDKAFGFPTEFNSSVTANGCIDGKCPLPGSAGSGSCPTCPGGSSSRSYSRGLFGRWR